MDEKRIARFSALRFKNEKTVETEDVLAEEVPVSFEYNGLVFTAGLATPSDLEDLAIGLSITEGIVKTASEILRCEILREEKGFRIAMEVSGKSSDRAKEKKSEKSSCTTDLLRFSSNLSGTNDDVFFFHEAFHAGFGQMEKKQVLKDLTGATHAASWMDKSGNVVLIREDVGRHNALDKLVGALFRQSISPASGAILVTSRASYEMVHKCAVAGASILAAASAPTAPAVRLAKQVNLSLVGFVRQKGHTVYAGHHRFYDAPCRPAERQF